MALRAILVVCLAICVEFSSSWVSSYAVRSARSQLSMAGGRTQAEKLMTKKEMFRELRGKLNEAAKIPGFFDVGQHVVCL